MMWCNASHHWCWSSLQMTRQHPRPHVTSHLVAMLQCAPPVLSCCGGLLVLLVVAPTAPRKVGHPLLQVAQGSAQLPLGPLAHRPLQPRSRGEPWRTCHVRGTSQARAQLLCSCSPMPSAGTLSSQFGDCGICLDLTLAKLSQTAAFRCRPNVPTQSVLRPLTTLSPRHESLPGLIWRLL